LSDEVGAVFAALSDPTRRRMVETLLRDGTTTVPRLRSTLPITRQAIAKHMSVLGDAGLVEREPDGGREVTYRLRGDALEPAADWLRSAESAWETRLARLKGAVEEAT
jgi:DNA-binding transcriptional ArsR family regulator